MLLFLLGTTLIPMLTAHAERFSTSEDRTNNSAVRAETKPFQPKIKLAAIYGADRRESLEDYNDRPYPLSSIHSLYNPSTGKTCTATFVGLCTLITNKHCILEKDGSTVAKLSFSEFRDITQTKNKEGFTVKTYNNNSHPLRVVSMGNVNIKNDPGAKADDDFAILQMDAPLGKKYGWLGVRSIDADSPEQTYTVAGFPFDERQAMRIDRSVKVLRVDHNGLHDQPSTIYTDAQVIPGNSGSPLYRQDTEGAWMVGLVYASKRTADGSFHLPKSELADPRQGTKIIPTDTFLLQLTEALKNQKCAAQSSPQ